MTVSGAYPVVRTFAAKREGLSVHAVEKIKKSGHFHGEQNTRKEPQSWVCTPSSKAKPSQSGTEKTDPFWDAPRLKPEFVAQVMGQAYGCTQPQPSVTSVYGRVLPQKPLLFDSQV